MATLEEALNWRGMKMVDADGDPIGTIEEIYADSPSREAEWATVKTGLIGTRLSSAWPGGG